MNELRPQTVEVLKAYLTNQIKLQGLCGWIAAFDWDATTTDNERELMGLLELLTTEISEGMEEERALRYVIPEILESLDPRGRHITEYDIAPSTTPSTMSLRRYSFDSAGTIEAQLESPKVEGAFQIGVESSESKPVVVPLSR
ncbi:MAG: hypothetical protein ACE5IZ_04265 [Dehalococcoidia bacterium]